MRRLSLLPAGILALSALPGPVAAQEDEAAAEVGKLIAMARRASERDRPGDALRNLEEALALQPGSPAVHAEILAHHGPDADGIALWLHHFARAAADARGRFDSVAPSGRRYGDAVRDARRLARARAQAADRLASSAKRMRGAADAPVLAYVRDAVRTVAEGNARLRAAVLPGVEASRARCAADRGGVLAAVEREASAALRAGDKGAAIRGARLLRGIAVQARRAGGADAALAKFEVPAAAVLRSCRASRTPETLTVADLLAVRPEDRPAWSVRHAAWDNPALVRTPNGRYLVESVCGLRSTLVVAHDLEYHHRRLAAWFGRDPFEDVVGTVRVCRSAADMEPEGAPYWWAGGFQIGHVTTIALNFDDRNEIGRLLSHELTHRFDAALYPLMPGWLAEGRAVYAETTSLWPQAERLDPRIVDDGRLWEAYSKRYDVRANLAKLVECKLDDYRDNYTAGYALWLYLVRYAGKSYGPRLPDYLGSFAAKPGLQPLPRFEQYLTDGKEGRARSFGGFASDFGRFLAEANAAEAPEWKQQWRAAEQDARDEAMRAQFEHRREADAVELSSPADRAIDDRSNWPRSRRRTDEPAVGEVHAFRAGAWLLERGQAKAALEALLWSLEVDESGADEFARIAAALDDAGHDDAAWALRLRAHALGAAAPGPAPAPIERIQRGARSLLETYADLAEEYGEGLPRAARAMKADHDRVARALGLPAQFGDAAGTPAGQERPPPDCPPAVAVLSSGAVEDRWSPGETEIAGRWHATSPLRLVLGRRSERTTSGLERDAYVRNVFVRGEDWYAGTYTFRTRVHMLSAFFRGGIVFGQTRRDRGLSIRFDGGDYAYAVGLKDEGARYRSIDVTLDDLRPADTEVGLLADRVEFDAPKESFELEVCVSGAFVRVRVDGRDVLSHRTSRRLPVSGRIGFFLRAGLVAFEGARVRRHRVLGPDAACPCEAHDAPLDLSRAVTVPWGTWPGRRVAGLAGDPLGTVLLCYTDRHGDGWKDADLAADTVRRWSRAAGSSERFRVAVPDGADAVSAPWGGAVPAACVVRHHGLPTADARLDRWVEEEAARRASAKENLTKGTALEDVRDELRSQPIWITCDPDGVIRARGLWLFPWHVGNAQNLLRRLRGY